jgi:hypothetical protein
VREAVGLSLVQIVRYSGWCVCDGLRYGYDLPAVASWTFTDDELGLNLFWE